jgi:hypothetical protein
MVYSLPNSVEGFAQILDKEKPGWENLINIANLNMGYHRDCILGQIYGGYSEYKENLFGPDVWSPMLESNEYKNDWIVAIETRRDKSKGNDFKWALEQIKSGQKVKQKSWSSQYLQGNPDTNIIFGDSKRCVSTNDLIEFYNNLDWELYEEEIWLKAGDRLTYLSKEYMVVYIYNNQYVLADKNGRCWNYPVVSKVPNKITLFDLNGGRACENQLKNWKKV